MALPVPEATFVALDGDELTMLDGDTLWFATFDGSAWSVDAQLVLPETGEGLSRHGDLVVIATLDGVRTVARAGGTWVDVGLTGLPDPIGYTHSSHAVEVEDDVLFLRWTERAPYVWYTHYAFYTWDGTAWREREQASCPQTVGVGLTGSPTPVFDVTALEDGTAWLGCGGLFIEQTLRAVAFDGDRIVETVDQPTALSALEAQGRAIAWLEAREVEGSNHVVAYRQDGFSDEDTVEQWRLGHPPGDPFPMDIALTDDDIWMLYDLEGVLVRLPRP